MVFFFGLSLQFYIPNHFLRRAFYASHSHLFHREAIIEFAELCSPKRACRRATFTGYRLWSILLRGDHDRLIVSFLYGDWIVCNSQRPLLSESLNRFLGWPLSR